MCPYMAGGRSRRGSPKAGTTVRQITLSTYNCHTAPLFKKLKLLTIKDMLALQELKFYYKLTHNELPAYFQNWQIVTNSEIHRQYT